MKPILSVYMHKFDSHRKNDVNGNFAKVVILQGVSANC